MTTTIISSSAEIIDFTAVKATMPFEAIKELWQKQVVADKSLSGGTVKVALALCWHMNRSQHGLALAKLTGLHRRTIIRTTQALERAGHVTITRSRRGTTNNPNQYRPILKQVGPECHHP